MKVRNRRIILSLLLCVLGSFVLSIMNSGNAFAGKATNVYKYINDKAYYQGIYNCYTYKYGEKQNGHYYDVKGKVQLDEVKNTQSMVYDTAYYYQPFAKTETLGCKNVFKKFSKKPNTGNADSIASFVEGMGYKIDTSDGKKCFSISFTKNGKKREYNSNMICPEGDGFKEVGKNDGMRLYVKSNNSREICLTTSIITEASDKCKTIDSGKSLTDGVIKYLIKKLCGMQCVGDSVNKNKTFENFKVNDQKMKGTEAKVGNRPSASNKAIKYLSDGKYSNSNSTKISDIEKRLLYQSYLHVYYNVGVKCTEEAKTTADGSIKWYSNGKMKTCYYSMTNAKHKDDKLNGVTGGFMVKGLIKGADDMLSRVKNLPKSYSDADLALAKRIVGGEFNDEEVGADGEAGDEDIEALCNKAGLKGLSWVACPVMSSTEETVSGLDAMIGSWLNVDTDLYKTDSPTYQVWEIMRNIANVALVIVLLVIIFSQLTGVGIDNYGIKKMLPRLIAMAILVNLSYLACQLVIDLSNILGVSLNTLFRGIGDSISPNLDSYIGEGFIGAVIASLFGAAGVGGAAAGTATTLISIIGPAGTTAAAAGGAVLSAPLVVVVVLLALIPVLLAVLLFFLMLGARMILVIICTAVAPVVCVLYILPNTQKWAKKWWNLFFAMLVMYPICGAIAGVSYLIKAMVLNMDGVHLWMAVVAMVGPFLPFFLLPTLLKNAISMLGNAGNALLSMGNRAASGANGIRDAIQNSDRYQKAINYQKREASYGRAARTQRRLNEILANGGTLSERQQHRLREAEDTTFEVNQERRKDAASVNPDRYNAREAAAEAEFRNQAIQERLSLLRRNGIDGHAFNLDGIRDRLRVLEQSDLNDPEHGEDRRLEIQALLSGASEMSGGGRVMSDIIRNTSNREFMRVVGDSMNVDSSVRKKLNEKDALGAGYAEEFTPGGRGSRGDEELDSFTSYVNNVLGPDGVRDQIRHRARTYEAGLNQSGAALDDYLHTLTHEDAQAIRNDEKLLNSLASNDRQRVLDYLAGSASAVTDENGQPIYDYSNAHPDWSVTTPTAQRVEVVGEKTGAGNGSSGGAGSPSGSTNTGGNAGSRVPPSGAAREGEEFSIHNPSRPVVDTNNYVDYQQGK